MIRQDSLPEKEIFNWLKSVESVDDASKISQSILLKLDNGFYVAGSKVEDVAFLSMSAAQSALAIAIAEFGKFTIQEVFVYTKGRNGKELPADSFGALPMSSLQVLLTLAEQPEIPVLFFADDGRIIRATLSGAAIFAPTSLKPFHKKAS